MAIETIKFSEFLDGGDLENGSTTVGLDGGSNAFFNSPWTFLPSGTTAERPAIAADMYYRLRFNTTAPTTYEFYDPTAAAWVQIEDSADINDLIARLAAHTVGDGASMIGLEDQGLIVDKTVQDLAEAAFIAQTSNGTLNNAQFLDALATGFLSSTTVTGVVASRIMTGTASEVDVANGDGSGVPTFSLSSTVDTPGTFTIGTTIVLDSIIDDDTFATATATNIPTSESVKAYVDNGAGGNIVNSVTGTASQVDINNADTSNPIVLLSSTIDTPGTFTIGTTIVLDSIIDDDTFATATATNVPTAESVKAYVDSTGSGLVDSVTGTANQVDVNNADAANPILLLSSTIDAPGTFTIQASTAVNSIIDDGTMASATNQNLSTSTAIKTYVDSIASGGFTVILTALIGTTANLSAAYANGASGVGATLTNNSTQVALTIDSVLTQVADRVLVKDQTAELQNGVYTVTTVGDGSTNWVLTRATDYDTAAEIIPGTLVPVSSGTVNGGSIWLETATVGTVGTDPVVFSEFAAPSSTYVTLATIQTISGAKTFSANIALSGGSTLNLNSTTSIDGFIDDDSFATASATTGATSESIKQYIDNSLVDAADEAISLLLMGG